MAFFPLQLNATPGVWRLFSARNADKNFASFQKKILERDFYTCQFCGFQARTHQEIINLDGNYRNNKTNNMVVACVFCSQCQFLEAVGEDYGGGSLIYLPEISQAELNGLCHALFCAIANATNYRNDAQSIYRSLKLRSQIVEDHMGENMSKPGLVGRLILENQIEGKNNAKVVQTLLKDVRLLPSKTKFSKQIEDWARSALDEIVGQIN